MKNVNLGKNKKYDKSVNKNLIFIIVFYMTECVWKKEGRSHDLSSSIVRTI